jgi:hypothetical protein
VILILCVLLSGPLVPALSDYSLPLVGILFLVGGLGAGFLSGAGRGHALWAAGQGISGILPAIADPDAVGRPGRRYPPGRRYCLLITASATASPTWLILPIRSC